MDEFNKRRNEIIAMAAGPARAPKKIGYLSSENEVWRVVSAQLAPMWDKHVARDVIKARAKLNLPKDHAPQLSEVTKKLNQLSGFKFKSVGGLAKRDDFFGALASKRFLSTQYLRHPSSPFYTDEPDMIHEVIGHGTLLTIPELAELHRLAGAALVRVRTEEAKQFIANVWWFSGEFGVLLTSEGPKAFGAGLLSSVGELEHFHKADIRLLDIPSMGLTEYRIDGFQKILFAGYSIHHVMSVVGKFFKEVTDEDVVQMTHAYNRSHGRGTIIDL